MRIQHVSVMFVIIFIPIILVTSYFISLQVNTIKLESDYSDKLLKATYDAMTAFELNTANEDLSTVSDSLRSILDASTNIFFNTLCTNLGVSNASKSFVQPYIPAILYTMYDGYYIYSPTNIPEICTDDYGRTIRTSDFGVTEVTTMNYNGRTIGIYKFDKSKIEYDVNTPTEPVGGPQLQYNKFEANHIEQEYGQILYKNNGNKDTGEVTYSTEIHTFDTDREHSTYYKRSYILKSYIPYSARYEGSGYNITVNYTLDNFLTVEGMIGNVYYTKSGYLIESDLVSKITVDGAEIATSPSSWTSMSEDSLIELIDDPVNHDVKVTLKDGTEFSNRTGVVDVTTSSGVGTNRIYWDDAKSAVEYYVKSYIFSNWFYEKLSGVVANTMKNTQYSVTDVQKAVTESITYDKNNKKIQTDLAKDMLHSFDDDTSTPFAPSNESTGFKNNPESGESYFYEHKRNVIKNSITYNMILSILVYSEESGTNDYNMPVFEETEWDTILNNVSITAFMQGMRCGLKYYNNYAIVTSTNNEISVTDNEIYYVPRVIEEGGILANLDDHDTEAHIETAHRIDCEKLVLGDSSNNFQGSNWLGCISFKSKEIKYDKILNKDGSYTYDHKAYTDYDCIVDSNYTVKNVDNSSSDGNTDVVEYLVENVSNPTPSDSNLQSSLRWKLLAYRIAIAKERNNLYKTTAFTENYGWQVITNSSGEGASITIPLTSDTTRGILTNTNINQISKIEVTIEGAHIDRPGVYTDEITASYSTGDNYNDVEQTISTTSTSKRTVELKKDFSSGGSISSVTVSSRNGTIFKVDAIKFYYK